MSYTRFSFREIDSDDSLEKLAGVLGTTYTGHAIHIPPQTGQGLIRKIILETGLLLRAWDFQLHRPFIFEKMSDIYAVDRVFHVAFILNPESLLVKTKGIEEEFRVQGGMNTLFVSNDIDIEVEISTDKGLHAVDFSFTASWLRNIFKHSDTNLQEYINQLLQSTGPTVFFESTSGSAFRTLESLHKNALTFNDGLLPLKAAAFGLLSGFFSGLLHKPTSEVLSSNFLYHEKMLEAEEILSAHIEKKLPAIEVIARQLALSESTLKRHFKLLFGYSVYEYYLRLKMEHARHLLMESLHSVSDIAEMLQYEKVSSFIEMFKRHHGISPGSLRRNRA